MSTMSKEYQRAYYSKNKAHIEARTASWYQANLERERAKRREAARARRQDPTYRARQAELSRESRERCWAVDPKRAWFKSVLKNARLRARDKGLPFALTFEQLTFPDVCPALGIPIDYSIGKGRGFLPNSPSLDRRDNCKGYTADNVCVISWRANLLKRDATSGELEAVAAYIKASITHEVSK